MSPASEQFKLIVGLGNPGAQYENTRHNAGFWVVDRVAGALGQVFRHETKFTSEVAKITHRDQELFLVKPLTYMNRSGQAVAGIARYFKIPPEKILVIHDELDLRPGVVRIKRQGGHGGHNGLRDLMSHLGNGNFWRLRIGVGHPGEKSQVINYVLDKPTKDEMQAIDLAMDRVMANWPDIIGGRLERAMHKLHSDSKANRKG